MGEKRSAYRVLVGKPEGNRLLGRPRHRWRMMQTGFEKQLLAFQKGLHGLS
jgi:hypothetical protein